MTFKKLLIRLKRPWVKFTYFLARRRQVNMIELKMKNAKELLEKRDELYKQWLEADKNDKRITEAGQLVSQIKIVDWVIGRIAIAFIVLCLLCSVSEAGQRVTVQPAIAIRNNQVTTNAGTRVQLSATSTPISSVSVKALSTNTGIVYVGDSSVSSSNGRELEAGESLDIDIANLNSVWFDVGVNGEGVSYACIK